MIRQKARRQMAVIALAVVVGTSPGCYGPFNLTRNLHDWNGGVGSEWVNELVFLGLVIFPVYALATLGDGIIFNSIEFWSGDNPISPVVDEDSWDTKTIEKDGYTVVLARTRGKEGRVMTAKVYKEGRLVDHTVFVATPDGRLLKKDGNGEVIAELRFLKDGTVAVEDSSGSIETLGRAEVASLLSR